mgnify:CR=1 FL=1
MADSIHTIMPETGLWPEGIYQLETTDYALGYDPETDVDGPANIQWEQLANRTRYLRNLLLVEHGEDGQHLLTDANFATAAGIPEENIVLAYPTSALDAEMDELKAQITAIIEQLESENEAELYGLTWSMQKVMPMAWERQGDKCSFEMFTPSLTLSLGKDFHITKAVYDHEEGLGDDSIDVDTEYASAMGTDGMAEGEWYVLCDAEDESKWQFACIKSILTDDRILLTDASEYTITDGWLRSSNVSTGGLSAYATSCFAWISDELPALDSTEPITITIRHAEHTDCVPVVEYLPGNILDPEWLPASGYGKAAGNNCEDDTCTIPAQTGPFHLRVSYAELENPVSFTMIAAVARHEYDEIETVRKPSVLYVETSGSSLVLHGSTYQSLYDIEQGGVDAQASATKNFAGKDVVSLEGAYSTITVPASNAAYVRMRYRDNEGVASRWSDPKAVE